LRDASPRNTPPGDPSGGVVYLRIVLSPEEASCLQIFLNMNVLQGRVVSTSPNPQAEGPPLVGCPRLLIHFIRSYPPYRRPFLYPKPEDAPCRGDRDPLHIGEMPHSHAKFKHVQYRWATSLKNEHYQRRQSYTQSHLTYR